MSISGLLGIETSRSNAFSPTLKFRSIVTNSWNKCLQDSSSKGLSEEERKLTQEIIDKYDDGNHFEDRPPYQIKLFHEHTLLGHKKWFEIHATPKPAPTPDPPKYAPPPATGTSSGTPGTPTADIQRLRAEIASLYQENAQHVQQATMLSEEKAQLEGELAAERTNRQTAEATLEVLHDQQAHLSDENGRLQQESASLERKLQAEQDARLRCEGDMAALRQQNDILSQQSRQRGDEINRLTARLQQLTDVLRRLENPLSAALQEIAALRL
jgi:DNA repair exonuclease SbcCD ATPase subunit